MIAGVNGVVERCGLDGALHLRCGPVTLLLALPAADAAGLQPGEHVALSTSLQFAAPAAGAAAGALRLYGFITPAGRDLFELLLTGSGVGPRLALALLELGPPGLARALAEGDEKTLTAAKGVGPKLAKKLVLELGEKAALHFADLLRRPAGRAGAAPAADQAADDAVEAVVALGFTRLQAEQALSQTREDPAAATADAAALVRHMLSRLR
jgi:Holliday junction DNA helicase RuvA